MPRFSFARLEADLQELASAALRVLAREKKIKARLTRAAVGIFFIENRTLRKLKREHLGKDAETVDVLAFPEDPDFPQPEEEARLGEVYLNRTIARRDPARAEYLFIHGLLHLLGYRHEGKRDTMEMENLEKTLLERLRGSRKPI